MALLLGAALAPAAHAQTELRAGQTTESFALEPDAGQEFFVEVPEGASHLKLLLESGRVKQDDVDLLVRFAEPFDPEGPSILQQALYYSIGETGLEHLEITYASSPPLSPGRWHVLVLNSGDNRARNIELTAALERQSEPTLSSVEFDIAYPEVANGNNRGFNDQTSFTSQGGNNAATLGEARRRAFAKAVEMLEASFTSPVAVTVEAFFDPELESDEEDSGGALASAQTGGLANFPGARARETFYASSIVPRLAGTDLCRVVLSQDCGQDAEADVTIRFNADPPRGWWYGLERSPNGLLDGYDFIAVAVHEMLHGLGFLSFADVETGALAGSEDDEVRRTDAYTSQLVYKDNAKFRQVDQLSDEKRLEAFTSQADLLWDGDYGDEFWSQRFSTLPKPPLYAPREPNPGSSVSHVNFADIMFHQGGAPTDRQDINIREGGPELGAAWYLLRDAGWDEDPKKKLEGAPESEAHRGMWYDPARDGHGFDFQRVGTNWFLVFYTYDDAGDPEWYLAVGTLEDGVFQSDGNGLQRFTYDENDPDGDGNPQEGETVGSVELDLNATANSPACDDGADRSGAPNLARFSWEIDGQSGDWCTQPLLFGQQDPDPDFTGHWFAGQDDQGWGMTIQVRDRDDGSQILVNTLYFYDDEGNPRWAQGVTPDFSNSHDGQTIDMQQFDGYARGSNCAPDPCTLGDNAGSFAGPLQLQLEKPLRGDDAGSFTTLDVDYLGPENGAWTRNKVPIQMLSDPR
jgi:hypothetical protein